MCDYQILQIDDKKRLLNLSLQVGFWNNLQNCPQPPQSNGYEVKKMAKRQGPSEQHQWRQLGWGIARQHWKDGFLWHITLILTPFFRRSPQITRVDRLSGFPVLIECVNPFLLTQYGYLNQLINQSVNQSSIHPLIQLLIQLFIP